MSKIALAMKSTISILIMCFVSCSSSKQGADEGTKQLNSFNLNGKWKVIEVKFTGDIHKFEPSEEMSLYWLLGSNWNQTVGKDFNFYSNGHWSSDAFDIDKSALTYTYGDDLVLKIKNDKLNYQFTVPISDTSKNTMTWDIGNQVTVSFEYVKPLD